MTKNKREMQSTMGKRTMYMFLFSDERLRNTYEKVVASFERSIRGKAEVMFVPMRVDSPDEMLELVDTDELARFALEFKLITILLCKTGRAGSRSEGYLKMGEKFYSVEEALHVIYPGHGVAYDQQTFIELFNCFPGTTIHRYLKECPEAIEHFGPDVYNVLVNTPRDKVVQCFMYKNRWYHTGLNPIEHAKFLQEKKEKQEQNQLLDQED